MEPRDSFVYPAGWWVLGPTEYPHYIRFIARRSYTSTQSRRGEKNGEVVLYMPPDALKTSYTQGIGDVEMGGFIALAGADMAGAGSALAAGNFEGGFERAYAYREKLRC